MPSSLLKASIVALHVSHVGSYITMRVFGDLVENCDMVLSLPSLAVKLKSVAFDPGRLCFALSRRKFGRIRSVSFKDGCRRYASRKAM